MENLQNKSGTVNEELIGDVRATMNNFAARMFNPKLAALRAQNPFVSILPFPDMVKNVSLTANVPQDVTFDSGVKMVRFSGNGEYYVSRRGNAQIPDGLIQDSGSVMNPEDAFYYVEDIQQVSIVAPNACRVTVHCYTNL